MSLSWSKQWAPSSCLVYACLPGIHISPWPWLRHAAMTLAEARCPEVLQPGRGAGRGVPELRHDLPICPRRCYCTSRRKSCALAAAAAAILMAITGSVILRRQRRRRAPRRSWAWSGRAGGARCFGHGDGRKYRIICTSRWRSASRSSARGPCRRQRRRDAFNPPSACSSSTCRRVDLPGGAANRFGPAPVCLLQRRRRGHRGV